MRVRGVLPEAESRTANHESRRRIVRCLDDLADNRCRHDYRYGYWRSKELGIMKYILIFLIPITPVALIALFHYIAIRLEYRRMM